MARCARPRPLLSWLAILAAGAGSAGCQFNPSSLSSNGGSPPDGMPALDAPPSPPPDAPPSPPDDAPPPPDARPAPDAAPLPPADELVERGLITRYFIDEATDGAAVTDLEDATQNPLRLRITYDGAGEFIDDGGNRGLRWNAITEDGKAAAPLAEDGKVWLALDGTTTGTIEMVVDVDELVSGSRLSHIGEADDSGVFTLRLGTEPESLVFAWNNGDGGQVAWNADVDGLGRVVLHVVLDSGRADEDERVRLYANGVALQRTGGTPPARDEAIDIVSGSNTVYSLGNTAEGERGVRGTFFYAAMYESALDPAEVMHNHGILIANDDGPGR